MVLLTIKVILTILRYNYGYQPRNEVEIASGGYGQFTAMIWRDVSKVGFGYAVGKGQREGTLDLVVVGRYFPKPNVIGQFWQQVQPPVSSFA